MTALEPATARTVRELSDAMLVATADEQPRLLSDALLFAVRQGWIEDGRHYQSVCWISDRAYLDAALLLMPPGWFLHALGECVTPLRQPDDQHLPTGLFQAGVQWRERGGRLTTARARTLALAVAAAELRAVVWSIPVDD